jgi:hypothetical protein
MKRRDDGEKVFLTTYCSFCMAFERVFRHSIGVYWRDAFFTSCCLDGERQEDETWRSREASDCMSYRSHYTD